MKKYKYEGEKFLSKLFSDIHLKDSVIHSSNVSDKKFEKIKKYLDRQERVYEKALKRDKLSIIKKAYYDKYVIKEVPKSYINFLDNRHFNQTGFHLDEDMLEGHKRMIIEDQRKSLDVWIDYFSSDDSRFYPLWTKYWAFQEMLKIGAYNSKDEVYGRRDKKTVAPFIELNNEALSKVIDLVLKEVNEEEIEDSLKELISSGSFVKLYKFFLKKQNEKIRNDKTVEGKWIKYEQGREYINLFESLQGYNTGWCTAGEATCKSQLENGDFYVYYTKDDNNEYKIPRIAIRMDGNNVIGEIRGVGKDQNIESHFEDIVDKKLEEFDDKESYIRRINDSKMLTYIYTKHKYDKKLTKEDLNFVYEIDRKIEGFGYKKDPRIKEILKNRIVKKDLAILFNCTSDEIGISVEDIKKEKRLKYYYGDIFSIRSLDEGHYNLPEKVDGDLYLVDLINSKGLTLPKEVSGHLYLSGLKNAEGLILPEKIGGLLDLGSLSTSYDLVFPSELSDLDFHGLKTAKGLTLPDKIRGNLNLSGLETAENLNLPENIGGNLNLSGLINSENLNLPKEVGGLNLSELKIAEGLVLPKTIKNDLILKKLVSAKGLVLPKSVGGDLNLSNLTNVEGLVLPDKIGGNLNLSGLTSSENLRLPKEIGGLDLSGLTFVKDLIIKNGITSYLDLSGIISAEGLTLPKEVEGDLYFNKLKTTKGLILPEKTGDLDLRGITKADDLIFPKEVKDLNLSGLTTAEGLKLPEKIESLDLSGLTTLNNLVFPKEVQDLNLSGLITAEGLKLPEKVRNLDLGSLSSVKGLELPKKIEGIIFLNGLRSVEGLDLFDKVLHKIIVPYDVEKKLMGNNAKTL